MNMKSLLKTAGSKDATKLFNKLTGRSDEKDVKDKGAKEEKAKSGAELLKGVIQLQWIAFNEAVQNKQLAAALDLFSEDLRWCIDGGEWLVGKGPALIEWVQQLSEKKLRLVTTVDEILQVALPPAQKVDKADKKKKESEMQLAIALAKAHLGMKKAESRESFVGVPYGVLVERDTYSIQEVASGKVVEAGKRLAIWSLDGADEKWKLLWVMSAEPNTPAPGDAPAAVAVAAPAAAEAAT